MVVKINAIEVAEGRGLELEASFAKRAREVEGQPGFLGFELLRQLRAVLGLLGRLWAGRAGVCGQRL
jgi:heme-degrading monooxygenase HmoA